MFSRAFIAGVPFSSFVPVVPIFVAVLVVPLPKSLVSPPPTLPIITLANHGVAQTLSTTLTGKNTFVIAYAVATSTKIRLDAALTCHLSSTSLLSSSTVLPSSSHPPLFISPDIDLSSGLNPNHPFLPNHIPNFSTPSRTYAASVPPAGSQLV